MNLSDKIGRLIENYRPRSIAYAMRIVDNVEEAEDAVQDAAVRAIESATEANSKSDDFAGWWFCIVASCALNRRRKSSRRATVSLSDIDEAALQAPMSDGPEAALIDREIEQELKLAIRALPADQRKDFLAWADRNHPSNAGSADMPASSAYRQRLYRIRQRLRDFLPDPRVATT